MQITLEDVKHNRAVNAYIEKADESLIALGYTEHSYPHVLKVSPLGFSAGLWSMATSLVLYIVICNLTTAHKHTGEVIDSINKFFKED